MLSFLLAIHFLLAILIIGLVLIQKHEADGILGTGGGGAGKVFSIRGQANLLTRSTAVLMTLFFLNCLVMAKMLKHAPQQGSIIDKVAKESVPTNTASDSVKSNKAPVDGTATGKVGNNATPAAPTVPVPTPGKAPAMNNKSPVAPVSTAKTQTKSGDTVQKTQPPQNHKKATPASEKK